MENLTDYLILETRKPYELGKSDCMTFVADWVYRSRGVNPMSCVKYGTAEEAASAISVWGGIARVMGRHLRRAGMRMTRSIEPGDIALVALPNGIVAGAIRTHRGWVTRLDTGVARVPFARVIAAWRV